jgi:hypothetical protein
MTVSTIAVPRARLLVRTHVEKAWPLLLEICVVMVVYELYTTARWKVAGDHATAVQHGLAVLRLEHHLGIAWEWWLQDAALRMPPLVWLGNACYVVLHRPFLVTAALIVFARDRACYRRMRTTFVLSCGAGLLVFWLLPVAPPRLLPDAGFVDTLKRDWPSASYQPGARVNEFAAIPSFHVGWNVLAVWSLLQVTSNRRLRILLTTVPALMLLTVVVTANHYLLDAVAGVLIISCCYLVASRLSIEHRLRTVCAPRMCPRPEPTRGG